MDDDAPIAERSEPMTQKVIRCRRQRAETPNPNPRYDSNSPKEELLLEHVREFEEQFVNVYGNRFLFLCPPNEYGVAKFLPSTIRPTHLPYKELYEVKPCAQFLADFFNYDELNPPDRYPSVIPAPHSVMKWQAGDCFDLSMALCSLLIGVGYDAYCVSGFAPRFITTRNEARSACPQLEWELEEMMGQDTEAHEEDLVIAKKPPLKSDYQEARRMAEEEDKARMDEEEMKSDSEDDPSSEEDEFENRRIHCWVLVRKGQRQVKEDMYVEPTTGRIYDVQRCPYLKIDLVWNHKNLWVNMQVCNASQVELDLYNSRFFEYVMLNVEEGGVGGDTGNIYADGEAGAEDSEAGQVEQAAQILDMPPAWSERIDIPREAFHARCYQGEKTIFYHKCKVEQYAPYTQDDGLVQRITLYKDVRRQIPLEIREEFKHRRDRLAERRRRPMQNETVEHFLPGRPSSSTSTAGGALKQFREISAISRELLFYNSRLDGLVRCVELIGKKKFEHFEDRDDRLAYHSLTLDPSLNNTSMRGNANQKEKQDVYLVESMGEVPIRKMTQKYARNSTVPSDQDIHKICYFLAEQKIRVDYHREPGSLTYKSITYVNEDGNLAALPRNGPQPTAQDVQKLLQMQAICREILMESYNRQQVELTLRRKEESGIRASRLQAEKKKREMGMPGSREDVLEQSVYDFARESASVEIRAGDEEEKQEETTSKVDVLAPYLVDFVNKDTGYVQLDSFQAELVMKKCTQDFRKRLTDRAEIIQKRLEEEQDLLRKRRAQMQRRGDNVEKDEREFEKYQSQAMFRTQILEQRLARHEMQAIEKFQELERMLQEDPRLAAMWQREPATMGR